MYFWRVIGYLLLAVHSFFLLNFGMVAYTLGHEAGGWAMVFVSLCTTGFAVRRLLFLLDTPSRS